MYTLRRVKLANCNSRMDLWPATRIVSLQFARYSLATWHIKID